MILKTLKSSLVFLNLSLKKKLIKLQFIYLFITILEFINVSIFYVFLTSFFQPDKKNYLTVFINEQLNLSFNSFSGIIFMVVIFFISNFLTVFLNYRIFFLSETISASLASNFFKKIMLTKYETFLRYHPAEIIKKINIEIPILSTGIFQPLLIFYSKVIVLISFMIFIFLTFDYTATLFLIFLLVFYISIFIFFRKIVFNYGKKISKLLSNINKILYETLNNFQIIKLLKKEYFFFNNLNKSLTEQAKIKSYGYLIGQFPKSFIEFIIFSTIAFSFLIINSQKDNSLVNFIPTLGTLAFIGYRTLPIGQQIYSSLTTIKNSSYILDSIKNNFKIFSLENSTNTSNKIKKEIKEIFKLKLEGITFKYENTDINILRNFTHTFDRNKIYLINAPSGKGKTTLINIIMGFLKPNKGKIIINNKQLYVDQNIDILRKKIFFSPQFSFLFDANLYTNITLDFLHKGKINDKNYIKSLKEANLFKDLISHKQKHNKKIGHMGRALSGGQIQRIAIARLFYNKRDIMIFDEPTNNLDKKNKKIILEKIKILKKDRIVIILSHDVDIKKYSDKIINLN